MSTALDNVTIINYAAVRRISVAANFFHAYPRLVSNATNFATSDEYRFSIYRLGIPYFATGAVILLIALVANLYFFTKRGVVPGADDTHESDPNERNCVGRSFLLFSCFFNLAIILCIAIAFGSAFTMRAAAHNAHDVLRSAERNVSEHLGTPARFLDSLAKEVANASLSAVPVEKQKLAKDVQTMFHTRAEVFSKLVDSTEQLFTNIDAIDGQVTHLSEGFFWFTAVVLMSCIAGLLLSFMSDATTPSARRARITAFAFLLIPLAATWSHTAISTWIAVSSGDFCYAISDYHRAVISQASRDSGAKAIPASNVFARFELQCPSRLSVGMEFKRLNEFLGSSDGTFGLSGFSEGLNALTSKDISVNAWESARSWMQDRWEYYGECDTQVLLAGKLSYHICGDQGLSAMSAVGQLWLCSCGLTLLFTGVVGLLTWGHPPSEFCSGRELMYIYGAPELISAFGDTHGTLAKHSDYWKIVESGMYLVADETSSSSDADSKYKFDDEESILSTERPRRNAYTSHQLKNKVARLEYTPDSDSSSSGSSSSRLS